MRWAVEKKLHRTSQRERPRQGDTSIVTKLSKLAGNAGIWLLFNRIPTIAKAIPGAVNARASFFLFTIRNNGGSAFDCLSDEPTAGPANITAVLSNPRNIIDLFSQAFLMTPSEARDLRVLLLCMPAFTIRTNGKTSEG